MQENAAAANAFGIIGTRAPVHVAARTHALMSYRYTLLDPSAVATNLEKLAGKIDEGFIR